MSNRKKKEKKNKVQEFFKAASHVSITKTPTFIPMRRFFFWILDIRKNKPPVSVKYSTIFTFCVPQKFTIYTLEIKKAEQQNKKITKKKKKKDNSLFMNKYNFTNQTSTITIVQTTVWFFGKKKKNEMKTILTKSQKTLTSRLGNSRNRILLREQ